MTDDYPTHPQIEKARRLARLLDEAFTIPIIKTKIGLDPILGLIPGAGEVVTGLMGAYIIWIAYDLNLPRKLIYRMVANLVIDQLMGMIPGLGDLADWIWKSNTLNVRLLEAAYREKQRVLAEQGKSQSWGSGEGPFPSSAASSVTIDIDARPV